ncbi:gamma-glutamylcyclotransferase [Asanoa sp. WMMD1127]|uniref:gamma-glutamylcyclotransferase family protein n=1 Tax=Asanoa sp. WMMD1127 TaxID=3016107 RepID=UPI00241770D8|nr:gamma-glutamylcyclotransferase family protein [Asanoa sp. WMMD1127]MDG4822517.1 gamma-glutamylcyclotransferase [Asanoa sp. WMMD1127]
MPLLFSYGTLRDPAVQQANFGRLLSGRPDALPGHRLDQLKITSAAVVAVSGAAWHPVAAPSDNPTDSVPGVVFEITDAELTAADGYEAADYRRALLPLRSGASAWVYVAAAP